MSDVQMSLTRVLRGFDWERQIDRARRELTAQLNEQANAQQLVVRTFPETSLELLEVDESGRWATLTLTLTAGAALRG